MLATANSASNDVSVFPLLGSGTGSGSNLPLGLIIGTTVGIPAGLVLITVIGGVSTWLFYKYVQHRKRGSVNFGKNEPLGNDAL